MQYEPNVACYDTLAIPSEENIDDYQYNTRLTHPPITEYHDDSEYMHESRHNCLQHSSRINESPMFFLHPSSSYSGNVEGHYWHAQDIGYENVYGHSSCSNPVCNMNHNYSSLDGCSLATDNPVSYTDEEGKSFGRYTDALSK